MCQIRDMSLLSSLHNYNREGTNICKTLVGNDKSQRRCFEDVWLVFHFIEELSGMALLKSS